MSAMQPPVPPRDVVAPRELHRRLQARAEAAARAARLAGQTRTAGADAAAGAGPAADDRDPGTPGPIAPLPRLMSASRTVSGPQAAVIAGCLAVLVTGLLVDPIGTLSLLIGVATLFYIAAFAYRVSAFWHALRSPDMIDVPDDVARAMRDEDLPVYTVLVPAYHEPQVIGRLLASLERMDYPRQKLDVKLLLEADDDATYAAALAARPGRWIDIVRVPFSEPRTKPKACNVGLAHARGRYVTIYDAEDRPDPLQLRRAVVAFDGVGPEIACLQARLVYHNADQNLITRWFTTEYAMWFSQLLPGLVRRDAPLPLGGTSNHFRRDVLVAVGAWDPWNVTEDADLGIRLHRAGYRTRVLNSVTEEEANSDFVNWVKQRSRWYKGYLLTWLVHLRRPRDLYRQLGFRGFMGFHLFVGGTPLLALLNPVFWGLTTLWFIGRPTVLAELFPAWLYYLSLFCLVAGNLTFLYTWLVSARATGSPSLTAAALLSPIYWVMMSLAAMKAGIQLLSAPSFWEKTVHGLDAAPVDEETSRAPA
jgi:cellulose synthase/poly-beta-1,6-N-acetylglucosamine synthase-like glycosyltransferase